jgi:hypothetical protein
MGCDFYMKIPKKNMSLSDNFSGKKSMPSGKEY